jgi:aerobic carbon-monoxide dehydrogenase medium subunit
VKPSPFQYYAPESLDEVVALLVEHGDDAKPLAGGQSLVPMMSLRLTAYRHLVDLRKVVGLTEIERRDDHVRLGAMVGQAVAERNPIVAQAPLITKAIPHIGHFQIRNRGTVGGSIAHADPASELPAVALAMDAVMEVAGPAGVRRIPAAEFFVSTWHTALGAGEVLTAVEFPLWPGRTGFAVEEVARRHGDFALVGATVGVAIEGDRVTRAAIAMLGVGTTPVRGHDAEAALIAGGAAADLAEVGRIAAAGLTPTDDVHASAAYRRHVAAVVVRRALARALEEARS